SSHNVACLRIKDAVVNNSASLIVVASRWGELCDFARLWIRPRPGQEAVALAALTRSLLAREPVQEAPVARSADPAALEPSPDTQPSRAYGPALAQAVDEAAGLLAEARGQGELAVVYALPHVGQRAVEAATQEAANLAILLAGPERAAESLYILPPEGNGVGLRDMGVTPELLPGHRPVEDGESRGEVQGIWGIEPPASPGLGFREALAAARVGGAAEEGALRALVVLGDNPLLLTPDRNAVARALSSLDLLVVIDSMMTETAKLAHLVLPEAGIWAKRGTSTSADRRVLRLREAQKPIGDARPGWWALAELGRRLAAALDRPPAFDYRSLDAVMEEIAAIVPLYRGARYRGLVSGQRQEVPQNGLKPALALAEVDPASPADGLLLFTGRTLYTSLEAAAIGSPEADKLHREEFALIHPADAAALGLAVGRAVGPGGSGTTGRAVGPGGVGIEGAEVALVNGQARLVLRAKLTEEVLPGTVFVPLYYGGGAVTALLHGPQADWGVAPVRLALP
ncbi:MAG TPA: molybdopterin-dependent oxidoreductase, partial [Dehalococcoidia bacterium]|nr:molybdopterin-dependent oxidoreductase [Dehalococcoidia bacterium]